MEDVEQIVSAIKWLETSVIVTSCFLMILLAGLGMELRGIKRELEKKD